MCYITEKFFEHCGHYVDHVVLCRLSNLSQIPFVPRNCSMAILEHSQDPDVCKKCKADDQEERRRKRWADNSRKYRKNKKDEDRKYREQEDKEYDRLHSMFGDLVKR